MSPANFLAVKIQDLRSGASKRRNTRNPRVLVSPVSGAKSNRRHYGEFEQDPTGRETARGAWPVYSSRKGHIHAERSGRQRDFGGATSIRGRADPCRRARAV